MNPHVYYAEQSAATNPGEMAPAFAELPADIPTLRRIARGLVIHYREDDLAAAGIPDERLAEIDTRYAERRLQRIMELDDRPLTEERPPNKRLVGCCRDFTVLFLAMLRYHGIPARARVGFATYFLPDWNVDHEVAEVWDAAEAAVAIDGRRACRLPRRGKTDGKSFDALDLPRDRFLPAGRRMGGPVAPGMRTPSGSWWDPGLDIADTRSWPQLRHNLVHDLAALNKAEMLLWDEWGLLLNGNSSPAERDLLDRVAEATRGDLPSARRCKRSTPASQGLAVPAVVTSIGPVTETPRQVDVRL